MNESERFLLATCSSVVALLALNVALVMVGPQFMDWIKFGATFVGDWLGTAARF